VPVVVATVVPTAVAGPVFTVAGGCPTVLNARSAPLVVPNRLAATTRKWYTVPGISPLTVASTDTGLIPCPAERTALVTPYPFVRPHWK
jgi:hypothetical protein